MPDKFVAESMLILLHMEIVRYAVNTHYVRPDSIALQPQTPTGTQRQSQTQEGVYRALEGVGFRIGSSLMERLQMDKPSLPPPRENVDAAKVICKDLWGHCFRTTTQTAPVLRTDEKRMLFHIKDSNFRWLRSVTFPPTFSSVCEATTVTFVDPSNQVAGPIVNATAPPRVGQGDGETSTAVVPPPGPIDYLVPMCGIIRGALGTLGFSTIVEPKYDQQCVTFVVTFIETV